MLRGRRAVLLAAFALAATTAVTAGCGGGSGTSNALSLDPVAAAATKTQQAGAARIRFAMAVSGPRLHGQTVQIHGTGAIDGKSAELTFNLGSMLNQMGVGSAALGQLKHASMKEVVLEQNGDYVIYMRVPFLSSQLPGGKAWIKLDLTKLGKSAGLDLGKLMSGSQLEPNDLLSILQAEGAKVEKVGPATIDGVATTRYHVTVDMAQALKSKGLTSPLLSSVVAKMKTASENVWIGKDGLVRRVQFRYGVPQGTTPMRLAVTMDLNDYGAHVTIAAPPSSQVFDATAFAQQGLSGTH